MVSGIIKAEKNALFSMIGGSLGYTSALTEEIINKTAESDIVKAQLESVDIDVFTGLPFSSSVKEPDKAEKIKLVKDYFAGLNEAEKASVYSAILSVPSEEYLSDALDQYMMNMTRETMVETLVNAYAQKMGTTDLESIRAYFEKMTTVIFRHCLRSRQPS